MRNSGNSSVHLPGLRRILRRTGHRDRARLGTHSRIRRPIKVYVRAHGNSDTARTWNAFSSSAQGLRFRCAGTLTRWGDTGCATGLVRRRVVRHGARVCQVFLRAFGVRGGYKEGPWTSRKLIPSAFSPPLICPTLLSPLTPPASLRSTASIFNVRLLLSTPAPFVVVPTTFISRAIARSYMVRRHISLYLHTYLLALCLVRFQHFC